MKVYPKIRRHDVDSTVINLSWSAATDETNLEYYLLKSDNAINDFTAADAAEVIMDYMPYDDIDMPVIDGGLSPDTYYYNVIVRDEGGNRKLYNGASGTVVVTDVYTVSGIIKLPEPDTLTDGHYYIKLTDPFTLNTFGSDDDWPSGSMRQYAVYNVEAGNYFVDVYIKNSSEDVIYQYKSNLVPEVIVNNTDEIFIVNAETCPSISADAYETDSTILTTSNYITAGSSQIHNFHNAGDEDYIILSLAENDKIIISVSFSTIYTDTVLYLYNSTGTEVAMNDDSSGLYSQISYTCPAAATGDYYIRVIEKGNDSIGDYILNVIDGNVVYTVSGTINLSDVSTLSGLYYYDVEIYTLDGEYYTSVGIWPSGAGTATFTIGNIPPVDYYTYAAVVDKNSAIHYEYESSSADLSVSGNITAYNINVDSAGSFYDVSGTITLPGTDTLSNGYYIIELFDSHYNNTNSSTDFWLSGHSVTYLIENITPEGYSVTVTVMDSAFNITHEYDSGAEDLVITNSDVERDISVITVP